MDGGEGIDPLRLPSPCVVLLVGPGASGKTTWAQAHFPADAIVSSDRLRALVGFGEDDIEASTPAFELLETVLEHRLTRRITTVIDTLGLDADRRLRWLALARQHGLPCVAVAFDTPARECRERNRGRAKRIPADVLTAQLRAWSQTRDALTGEGYHDVITPQPVRIVPAAFVEAAAAPQRQRQAPRPGVRFGLQVATFDFPGKAAATAGRLREIAVTAEAVGFDAIYVMDHFRQIPQVGRAWHDMLESYTTLGYLAACTERMRIGTLVTGITYRNVAHLGKIVATLDVLSGGRAICGLGIGWFEQEHRAYGWDFPAVRERYALLQDTLELLPLLWGAGSPPYEGRVIDVPEAVGYPRPLQEHVPIMIGGSGEKRTLRLAAQYADMCNVFGDATNVRRKAAVLRTHCEELGRDHDQVEVTHLGTALVGEDDRHLSELVERLRPRRQNPAQYAASINSGTVSDHVGRCHGLTEAGAAELIVRLPNLADSDAVARMGKVIAAFR